MSAYKILLAGILVLSPTLGWTADIQRVDSEGNETTLVFVAGDLASGDEKTFIDQIVGVSGAIVVLSSNGGDIHAALEIGKAIRLKGFSTFVPEGEQCASACGLIWLGGQRRYMAPTASIGFHAAYEIKDGKNIERGAGNALVGAYLGSLGFSNDAIYFVTSAPPEGMNWINLKLASEMGIGFELWDPSGSSAQVVTPQARLPKSRPEPGPGLVLVPKPVPTTSLSTDKSAGAPADTQRAIYYFQGEEGTPGRATEGTVAWTQITRDRSPAVLATLRLTDWAGTATVTIYKNKDATLPASHLVVVQFSGDLSARPIKRIPALVLKETEQTRGNPLTGAAVSVTKDLFWIALSDDPDEIARNLKLLREGLWFDIPILFNDGTRALVTFEKGLRGHRIFEAVINYWDSPAIEPSATAETDIKKGSPTRQRHTFMGEELLYPSELISGEQLNWPEYWIPQAHITRDCLSPTAVKVRGWDLEWSGSYCRALSTTQQPNSTIYYAGCVKSSSAPEHSVPEQLSITIDRTSDEEAVIRWGSLPEHVYRRCYPQ